MGLDMYLNKRTYVKNWKHMKEGELHSVLVTKGGKQVQHIKPERVSYVEEEVAYWRKANQIHQWFVANVQKGVDDCGDYYVDSEKLKSLVDLCKTVLADKSKASELLPAKSGFFFGGTEYDEYYFSDLEDTIKMLEPLIAGEEDNHADLSYNSSW